MIEASDFFTELFITSVAMLESDYESEFVNATRLLEKVMGLLDQPRQKNEETLTNFKSSNRPNFPGVQALLMKVTWCEEGVCGCGGGERHMHCSVPKRRVGWYLTHNWSGLYCVVGICLQCAWCQP